MSFTVTARDPKSPARCGVLRTAHGDVETPVFMPVATQATVKAMTQEDLASLGYRMILSNSYHLYLRPGTEIIAKAGGLHRFMNFDGAILTDSGGFQVFSLSDLRSVHDEGVDFKSHIDGSSHKLTPEKVIGIQAELGSDCWTILDHCLPYPATRADAELALRRTNDWMRKSVIEFRRRRAAGARALFFPILQGGFHADLRKQACAELLETSPDGICFGGFSVGEPKNLTWEILSGAVAHLPEDKPRYLMGVGTPEDLWDAVSHGVDMLDCVWPTRVARNGQVMTKTGRYNIGNNAWRSDNRPLEEGCACWTCSRYTRAYLSHLFRSKELSFYRYISYHNLHLMQEVVKLIRASIRNGNFIEEKRLFLDARASNLA